MQTIRVNKWEALIPSLESHADLEMLFDILPIGIVILDIRGIVRTCNPLAESFLGIPLEGEAWQHIIARAFSPQEDDGCEISLRDGRRVDIKTRSLPSGRGQFILITDLTETRRLQTKLSTHQRLISMGKMLASVAHQIRTPLSSALLYANNLSDKRANETQKQKFCGKLSSELHKIEHQISDMLCFAKGGGSVIETLSLDAFLQSLHNTLAPQLETQTFEIKNTAGNIAFRGNPEALQGALENLILNAKDACAEDDGRICLRIQCKEKQLEFAVLDNGKGMTAETLAHLFEPFYTTKTHGTGLGLAVAHAVATAHHGKLFAYSKPKHGSEFCLQIPILLQEGESS